MPRLTNKQRLMRAIEHAEELDSHLAALYTADGLAPDDTTYIRDLYAQLTAAANELRRIKERTK